MPIKVKNRFRQVVYGAAELRKLTGWEAAVVEDYLGIRETEEVIGDSLELLLNKKLEEWPTAFPNFTIPVVKNGFIVSESPKFTWNYNTSILNVTGSVAVSVEVDAQAYKTIIPNDRIVFVAGGYLSGDAKFTWDGSDFVMTGDMEINGDLVVTGTIFGTLGTKLELIRTDLPLKSVLYVTSGIPNNVAKGVPEFGWDNVDKSLDITGDLSVSGIVDAEVVTNYVEQYFFAGF